MAEDQDSKTEEATPKKLAKLREKGQVAQSAEVAGAATVLAVCAMLAVLGGRLATSVGGFSMRIFRLEDVHRPFEALAAFQRLFFGEVLPIAAASAVAAVVVTVVQTKGLFAFGVLAPDPKRMNPVTGLQKVLPTPKMLQELGKSFLKVVVVGFLVYRLIHYYLPRFGTLPAEEPEAGAALVGGAAIELVVQGVVLLAVLAALDYVLNFRRFQKDSKMAKHEVKDEHKQSEGDPQMKAKRRQKQREVARSRTMIQEVADATVVVTNPTHISVALRYGDLDPAPRVVAMGTDALALRLRVEARAHGVPILENRPLARALHATAKVGQVIPVELYEMAAPVIAHVLRLQGAVAPRGGEA